jgi:prepilin-type N-terminal cleavage/methylation domain-containing protein
MPANEKGYTLIELIVVIVLIGMVLSFAAPRLRHTVLEDPLKAAAREMIGLIHTLRNEAVRKQQAHALYVDVNANRFWAVNASMTPDEQGLAREKARDLPPEVLVRDVWIKGEGKFAEGEARIVFTPKGYTQSSAIHLRSQTDKEITLALSPFMGKVTVVDKYVEFD